MKIAINKIVYREDLYPRFEANQALIQRYAYSIEHLPAIKINQANILIDGFHRWKAHQLNGETEIAVEVIETDSEKELKRLAYQLNSNHGLQLTNDEKRRYAAEMIGEMSVQALADVLSVGERTIARWTETQRKALEEDRNRKIVEEEGWEWVDPMIKYDFNVNAVIAVIDIKWDHSQDKGMTATEKGVYEWFLSKGVNYYIVYIARDFSSFRVVDPDNTEINYSPVEYADWLLELRETRP